jgi:CBS domain-containing protein
MWQIEGAVVMNSTVRDVMTRDVVALRETASYKDIIIVMRLRHVSAFPVTDSAGHVLGVVSEADLLPKEAGPEPFTGPGASLLATGRGGERAKASALTAGDLMSRSAVTIGPDASVAEAARLMYDHRVKRLPVVDGDDRLVGIVSRVDVLSVFARPDGEIRDEVISKVIVGEAALDPSAFEVIVTSGIVTVSGQAGSQAAARHLLDTVKHVEGVVGVRDRISYPAEAAAVS